MPVNDTLNNNCVFTIEAVVFGKGNLPDTSPDNAQQVVVYFDFASTNAGLRTAINNANDTCATCVGSIQKSVNHQGSANKVYGGFIRAARVNATTGLYRARFLADFPSSLGPIGVSVFIVTLDGNQMTNGVRTSYIRGPPNTVQAFTYNDMFSSTFAVTGTQNLVNVFSPYSPFRTFTGSTLSSQCVNVFSPIFVSATYNVSIAESVSIGTTVATVKANDADSGNGGLVKYSIVSRTDSPAVFALNTATGAITTTALLDREAIRNYTIVITAQDSSFPFNNASFPTTVTIVLTDVNDNPPVFQTSVAILSTASLVFAPASGPTLAQFSVTIPSGTSPGAALFSPVATDADLGSNAVSSFTLINDTTSGFISMSPSTFAVSISSFVFSDATASYTLGIRATDGGGLTTDAQLVIIIEPKFKFMKYYNTLGGLSSPGSLRASTGLISLDNVISYNALTTFALSSIEATLISELDSGLYWDVTTVRAVIELKDQFGAIPDVITPVNLTLTPNTALADDLAAAGITVSPLSGQCTVSASSKGSCIASVSIPSSWARAVAGSGREVDVTYGYADERAAYSSLSSIPVNPPLSGSILDGVLMVLPEKDITVGQVISVPVYVQLGYDLTAFSLVFRCNDSLAIKAVSLQDTSKWLTRSYQANSSIFAINGIVKNILSIKTDPQPNVELLLHVLVEATVAVGAGSLSGSLLSASHADESNVDVGGQATPVNVLLLDKFSPALKSVGVITISNPLRIRKIVSSSAQGQLFNTARLTGVKQTVAISSYAVLSSGVIIPLDGSDLVCSSSDTAVLQVDATCSSVFLDGSESSFGSDVTISIALKNDSSFSSSLSFEVWSLTGEVDLALDYSTLSPINGYLWNNPDTAQCEPAFMRSAVQAWANFTKDGSSLVRLSIGPSIAQRLTSSNSTVAFISDGMVVGKAAGETQIEYKVGGSVPAPIGQWRRLHLLDNLALSSSMQHCKMVAVSALLKQWASACRLNRASLLWCLLAHRATRHRVVSTFPLLRLEAAR
jgi:hypothetical protein